MAKLVAKSSLRGRGRGTVACMICCALLSATALANERGTVIRTAVIYVAPDVTSARLATTDRGREAVVLERTPGWVHVIATLNDAAYNPDPEAPNTRNVTGWILDKGYISETTAKGDQILFGEAADCEDQASRSHGRKGAAADARRLYYRVFDLFPKSPLAGEALYRAADIQWQLDRRRYAVAPLLQGDESAGPPADRRASHAPGAQEIPRHQVGRHGSLPDAGEQDVRRLGRERPSVLRKKPRFTRSMRTSIPTRPMPPRPTTTQPTAGLQ